jgi:hypothetical protein
MSEEARPVTFEDIRNGEEFYYPRSGEVRFKKFALRRAEGRPPHLQGFKERESRMVNCVRLTNPNSGFECFMEDHALVYPVQK